MIEVIERLLGGAPRVNLRDTAAADETPSSAAGVHETTLLRARTSYRGLREIARGGMGIVLRGRDNDLGRDVALKVLHKDLATRPEVVQRFVEEAQIGGQLQHPGIVPVYELGLLADGARVLRHEAGQGSHSGRAARRAARARDEWRELMHVFEAVCQTIARALARRDPPRPQAGQRDGRRVRQVQVVDRGWPGNCSRARPPRRGRRRMGTTMSLRETLKSAAARDSPSLLGSVMVRRPTCRPSRPAARSTTRRSAATCSRSARSCARCSPASRPTLSVRVKPLHAVTPKSRTPRSGWTRAEPMRS